MAATVSATTVRVALSILTLLIVAFSKSAASHPTVHSAVKTAVVPGESNPDSLIYQIDVTSHIIIKQPNRMSEKQKTDNPNHCHCALHDDAEKRAAQPHGDPHDCGCVLKDDAEKTSRDNRNHCHCVLHDDAEKMVTQHHGDPHDCGCVLKDDTEKTSRDNRNHCHCVHHDDVEMRATQHHDTPEDSHCQCPVHKHETQKTTTKPRRYAYKLYDTPKMWYEAKRTCEQEGTHLVIINSKAEEDLVKIMRGRHRRLFVGFHYLKQGDRYETVLGERINSSLYANWNKETGACSCSELCGTMWFTGEIVLAKCNDSYAFICEEPV